MGSRTLVLGANGMIGRRLVPLLEGKGEEVLRAGRSSDAEVPFDWNEQQIDGGAIAGVDTLYLVPPPMVADPADQVASLLETLRATGLRKVVAISSLGVTFSTEPQSSGRARYESTVRACGADWTLLRPSGFMQNLTEGFMAPAVAQGSIAAAAGDGKVALVDAADIAEVAAVALTEEGYGGRTFALTGPAPLGFREVAEMISAVSGRTVRYTSVSTSEMRDAITSAGVPGDYADILLADQEAIRQGKASIVSNDVREVLGREPLEFAAFLRTAFGR